MTIYKIDAAVSMAESYKSGGHYCFPKPNPEYKYLMNVDGWPAISKDRVHWCLAAGVVFRGEKYVPQNLLIQLDLGIIKLQQEEKIEWL